MMATTNMTMLPEWRAKYDRSLQDHLTYFAQAARKLGVPPEQIEAHDKSKYSPEEYTAYVRKFGGGVDDAEEFNMAWLHHVRSNPHHWQHWIIPGGRGERNTILRMPRRYVVEMVADWMGSGRAYTGEWDMTPWLKKNYGKIALHSGTARQVNDILDGLGYNMNDIFMASRRR